MPERPTTIRLSPEDRADLEELARLLRLKRSDAIRRAIREELRREREKLLPAPDRR